MKKERRRAEGENKITYKFLNSEILVNIVYQVLTHLIPNLLNIYNVTYFLHLVKWKHERDK